MLREHLSNSFTVDGMGGCLIWFSENSGAGQHVKAGQGNQSRSRLKEVLDSGHTRKGKSQRELN